MDENEVVTSTCGRLEAMGCTILERRNTTQHGIDIVAHHPLNGHCYYVEAKGGTSSKESSARFGRQFTQSQVFDRVAKGIFTCLQLRAAHFRPTDQHVILAVPDAQQFRSYLVPVIKQLQRADIEVWFQSNEKGDP